MCHTCAKEFFNSSGWAVFQQHFVHYTRHIEGCCMYAKIDRGMVQIIDPGWSQKTYLLWSKADRHGIVFEIVKVPQKNVTIPQRIRSLNYARIFKGVGWVRERFFLMPVNFVILFQIHSHLSFKMLFVWAQMNIRFWCSWSIYWGASCKIWGLSYLYICM